VPHSRRTFLSAGAYALGALGPAYLAGPALRLSAGGLTQAGAPAYAQAAAKITTTDLSGATLFQGAGCNVIALPGPEGALMIDGGRAANADALLAAVKAATRASRIHTLINTHWHPEQTGVNEAVGRDGGAIIAHEKTKVALSNTIYASETFKGRLAPLSPAGRPTKTWRSDGTMEFAGQLIDYGYMPAAHTDGDIYLHVPKLNLLVVGGVLSAESWPLLDYRNGAWLGGRVRAAERLATLVKPDTRVVPTDGRLMTGADVLKQRDMYQQLFKTMIVYLNSGFGPEDAVIKNPLKAYEAQYGDSSTFTYGALRSMMIAYVPD
jgi:glyoxylase-like metal-dependent hydrolase (beta-lactamase superfamily II)